MVDVIPSVIAVFNHAYAEITQKLYGYLYSTSFYFRHIFGIVRQSLVSTSTRMALSFTCPRDRTCTPDIMHLSSLTTHAKFNKTTTHDVSRSSSLKNRYLSILNKIHVI